jgi:quercetin dioxygenase-like cupin family protein
MTLRKFALPLLALVLAAPAAAADSLFTWSDLAALKVYHAYSASDGLSYIEEIAVPAQVRASGGKSAQIYFDLKPQAMRIARSATGSMIDWHYAGDSRHLIIPMQGDMVFDLGDGKLFHVKPGEAILAEDWTGKGHRSGCLNATQATCVVIDVLVDANPKAVPLQAPPKR